MAVAKVETNRDELVKVLAELSWEHGPRISVKKFTRLTGIPESQVYRYFDSWGDVRVAAGLKRRIKLWPDEFLLRQAISDTSCAQPTHVG